MRRDLKFVRGGDGETSAGGCARARRTVAAALLLAFLLPPFSVAAAAVRLAAPDSGVYHAAHPDFGVRDDGVTVSRVRDFTALVSRKLVWSYVSSHWDRGIVFPAAACRLLHGEGIVPLIGIMPWSTLEQGTAEKVYTLERLLVGDFDAALRVYAREAASLGFPIMMEFGPECNGSWFPWSGAWHGKGEERYGEVGWPDGPERFRDAFRRVVRLFREEGAGDVTWVFHIAADAAPKEAWNSARYYYPGDEYVDWIGVSVYGRLREKGPATPFDAIMSRVYSGLAALSPAKPIAVLEMGVSDHAGSGDKPGWIRDAFESIHSGKYPRLKAVAWWNKIRRPDGTRSTLEIDSSPESLAAYREGIGACVDEAVWAVQR